MSWRSLPLYRQQTTTFRIRGWEWTGPASLIPFASAAVATALSHTVIDETYATPRKAATLDGLFAGLALGGLTHSVLLSYRQGELSIWAALCAPVLGGIGAAVGAGVGASKPDTDKTEPIGRAGIAAGIAVAVPMSLAVWAFMMNPHLFADDFNSTYLRIGQLLNMNNAFMLAGCVYGAHRLQSLGADTGSKIGNGFSVWGIACALFLAANTTATLPFRLGNKLGSGSRISGPGRESGSTPLLTDADRGRSSSELSQP